MQNRLTPYVEAFSSLHTARIKGYLAPHKPILLLAVIDLVEEGVIASPRIELTDALVRRFEKLWQRYLGFSTVFTPDVAKPFFHMQHECFWRLVSHEELALMRAAEGDDGKANAEEKKELPKGGYSVKAMRAAFAYAEMDEALYEVLRSENARAVLRVLLINTYLTNQPTKYMPDLYKLAAAIPLLALVG